MFISSQAYTKTLLKEDKNKNDPFTSAKTLLKYFTP